MLYVTIRTGRREFLIGMVNRAVVAAKAGLVGSAFPIAGLRHVAGSALLAQQRVRMCQRSGIVGFGASRHGMPAKPPEAGDYKHTRENPPPARNTVQRFEVIQIDALREFLGAAGSSGHLISEGHYGVHGAQDQKGDGERDMHQQPGVQPSINTNLMA